MISKSGHRFSEKILLQQEGAMFLWTTHIQLYSDEISGRSIHKARAPDSTAATICRADVSRGDRRLRPHADAIRHLAGRGAPARHRSGHALRAHRDRSVDDGAYR